MTRLTTSSVNQGDKLGEIRSKAKNDLYFFSKDILGYDLIEEQPHRELTIFLTKGKKPKKLILMPRGSFKSTIVTVSYPLWRLMNDPDLRVLISSETFNQSKSFLKAITSHVEQNETFKGVFGDMKGGDSVWRQEEITLKGRKKVAREASISVSGVGQTRVGFHYDLIILDDVVSNNNINTPEQIRKIIEHYKLLLSILEPGAELIIVGTRYSFADLYGHLLEEEKESFAIHRRSAIQPDGSLLFPSRLTKEFLDSQRRSMGSLHFANQYLNNPIDEANATFRGSWIKFYENAPENIRNFMLIDPASTNNKQSDFTGIVICGIDCYSNIFVREAINLKETIADMVDVVFKKVVQYKINEDGCVGLEVNANQLTYQYIFTEEMNKRKVFFSIKELRPHSKTSKDSRIKALQPYFENGKILLKKDQSELYQQITMYPRWKHDDLVDALCNILVVMTPADRIVIDKWQETPLSKNEVAIWKAKEDLGKKRMVNMTKYRW